VSVVVEFGGRTPPPKTRFPKTYAGKASEQMKWNWKWAVGLGGGFLLFLYLTNNPGALKGISR
jgi:hypothetical protein